MRSIAGTSQLCYFQVLSFSRGFSAVFLFPIVLFAVDGVPTVLVRVDGVVLVNAARVYVSSPRALQFPRQSERLWLLFVRLYA